MTEQSVAKWGGAEHSGAGWAWQNDAWRVGTRQDEVVRAGRDGARRYHGVLPLWGALLPHNVFFHYKTLFFFFS